MKPVFRQSDAEDGFDDASARGWCMGGAWVRGCVHACMQNGQFRTEDGLGSQARLPSLFPIMLIVGLQLAARSSHQIVTSQC
jgi:hypothetical protein